MLSAAKKENLFSASGGDRFVCSLAVKPHPGHQLPTAALHRGIDFANSNTVTGFRVSLPAASIRPCLSTYTRDGYTGLDYADQRYYASTYGRFNTADPYQASGGPKSPASWNRYSYTRGDPVNRVDPGGLADFYAIGT